MNKEKSIKKFDSIGHIELTFKCLESYKNHTVDNSSKKKGEEMTIDMGFQFNHSELDDEGIINLVGNSTKALLRRYFYDKYIDNKKEFNKVNRKL